jgi:N-acetylmuramoyl-L-alanine amidase
LREQADDLSLYDQQGMTGDLYAYAPAVPGFIYWDMPREFTARNVANMLLGNCVERFCAGYVLPEGATETLYDEADLALSLMKAGGDCVKNGVLDEVTGYLASRPGSRAEDLGGRTVYRDEQSMTVVIGDVVITLATLRPDTLPDGARPITSWDDLDAAYVTIVRGIESAARARLGAGDSLVDAWLTSRLIRRRVIRSVQELLQASGYYHGPIDGIAGRQTENAVRACQQRAGITVDGMIGPEVIKHLEESALTESVGHGRPVPIVR